MSLRDVSVEQLKARAAGIYVTVHLDLDQELRVMSPKAPLIVMIALLGTSFSVKAEEPKAGQPYTEQLGDHQVTSVKREITKGGDDRSREELFKGRTRSHPTKCFPVRSDNGQKARRATMKIPLEVCPSRRLAGRDSTSSSINRWAARYGAM